MLPAADVPSRSNQTQEGTAQEGTAQDGIPQEGTTLYIRMIQQTEDSTPPSPPYIPASPIYSPAVCSVPSSTAWEPAEDPDDYVYASTPDRSSCSTPQSQIRTWPEDRKGLAALVPWYHREFPEREDHPARTRRQYEKEEQEFEDLKMQFWWQYVRRCCSRHPSMPRRRRVLQALSQTRRPAKAENVPPWY